MHSFSLTPGLLVEAEVAYRHEQVASDLSGTRRIRTWWDTVHAARTTARRNRPAATAPAERPVVVRPALLGEV